MLGAEGRPRAHQRHAGEHGARSRSPCSRPSGSRAPPTSRRRCRSTRCADPMHPFDPRIHAARPVPGQARVGRQPAAAARGSAINASHANCGRVQDAYSMRCAPQVHGAARDALGFVRRLAEIEINAATDNPMVFADTGEIVSGGNFHGAPVALAADVLAIGARPARDDQRAPHRSAGESGQSGLPAFLTRDGGLQVGADDGARDGRGLDLGDQDARASGERRHDPDLGQKGGSRQHEHGRRAQGSRAASTRAHVLAIEMLVRLSGDRSACAAHDVAAAGARARACAHVVPTLAVDRSPAPDIDAHLGAHRARRDRARGWTRARVETNQGRG